MQQSTSSAVPATEKQRLIKCVVWDLDDTLWEGILSEDREVRLRPGVSELIAALDGRGILQSIASKNDHATAMAMVDKFGLAEYFLHPQINWQPKSVSIAAITKALNLGPDAIAFIDDQPFERDEVHFALPQTLCVDSAELDRLLHLPELTPRFITEDTRKRRLMYLADIERNRVEAEHVGTPEQFLASLSMRMVIAEAALGDLERAEELTVRTNQLNTTGYSYSYEELDEFRRSPDHDLLIASLNDKYGSYGKIGLALVERTATTWTIKLLLMSCRVMSRGVGTVLLSYILQAAKAAGVRLFAEFIANDRNRMMYVTYKLAGFKEVSKSERSLLLENNLSTIQPFPSYVKLQTFAADDGAAN
jgi:FkbH-like protein